MSKANWVFMGLSLMVSTSTFAQTMNKSIECKEMSPFDPTDSRDVAQARAIGTYKVKLNKKGQAVEVSIEREAMENFPTINETFNLKNSMIAHEIRDGTIEGLDEETKEPMYSWNIKKVETISVINDKISVGININDHLYAGVPGSSVELNFGDKRTSSTKIGHLVFCSGPLRLGRK